jgi:hypothetical protein
MRATSEQRLETLKEKRSQIDAELTRLESKMKTESRKRDTRRKILVGAVILQEMDGRPDFEEYVTALLQDRLIKPRDRALFNLAPKEE